MSKCSSLECWAPLLSFSSRYDLRLRLRREAEHGGRFRSLLGSWISEARNCWVSYGSWRQRNDLLHSFGTCLRNCWRIQHRYRCLVEWRIVWSFGRFDDQPLKWFGVFLILELVTMLCMSIYIYIESSSQLLEFCLFLFMFRGRFILIVEKELSATWKKGIEG